MNDLNQWQMLLPVAIPFAVAVLVRLVRRLPKWTVPTIVTPALGFLAEVLTGLVTGQGIDPQRALIYSGLATLFREAYDQLVKAGRAAQEGERVPRVGDAKISGGPRPADLSRWRF